ncbi:MAG: hypothetical protein IKE45_03685 [Halomonas sp.]|nr:hypothetical protein [Halomonas sp.]MBR2513119.1 hypothetical protein [Halomonas sp.]
MRQITRTSSTQRMGGRWLALLLALLLAMVTLSSHGAIESHPGDCGVAVEWMADDGQSAEHDAPSCATCTTASDQLRLIVLGPDRLAKSLAMAVFPQIPLTPERPPRA